MNTVPFNVLSTDCSVRVFAVDTGTAAAAVLVHNMVESSRPGTVQVIVYVVPTVKSVCCPDMVISVEKLMCMNNILL